MLDESLFPNSAKFSFIKTGDAVNLDHFHQ
ncbi:MAG: 4'-phosphopantetheinyl transferase, partial [Corynebacterium glutamicum]|nr:4'-phosphopantetheinyl transferase [Corynebacterium glutamicum]